MSLPSHWWRGPAWALALAVTAAFLLYVVGYAIQPDRQAYFAIVGFLFILPAFLSAFVCALADPRGEWGADRYLKVPLALIALVVLGALAFLREGLICLAILAPPWIGAGIVGTILFYRLRRGVEGPRLYAAGFLLIPLLAVQAENRFPPPWQDYAVSRTVTIAAPPGRVWPLLQSLPDIRADEGRWTISQNLLGVPRPQAAVVRTVGGVPVRHARWGDGVRFDEALTRTVPGRALAWDFVFPDPTLHHRVDRHIHPRGPMLDVASGSYRLDPAGAGTRLTLVTRYRVRSWAAPYAALWGELILGDIQRNILAVLADRAETRERT